MKTQVRSVLLDSRIQPSLFVFLILCISQWGRAVDFSQDSAMQLPSVMIEERSQSSGTSEPNRQVITRDEIQNSKHTHLVEVLKEVAGLDIVTSGGSGQNASIFIRGSKNEHTLVLIDGVEISDPTTTARVSDISLVRADQIERIEILKGPQAMRYGSDAVGGLIHIITQKGEGPFRSFYNLEGGSFRTESGYWQSRGSRGPLNYNFGVQSFRSQGFSSADAGAEAERDSSDQSTVLVGLGYQLSESSEIDLKLRNIRGNTDLDFSGGPLGDDPNYHSRSAQTLSALKLSFQPHTKIKSWLALSSAWIERNYKNEPDSRHSDHLEENFKSQNSKYETWHQYLLAPEKTLELGLQFKEERGSSDQNFNGSLQNIEEQTQSLFGQALIFSQKGKENQVEIALRHDQGSQQKDSLLNSSFKWNHDFKSGDTVLQIQGGSGFKSPSLFQLYSQFGNENLKAERVFSGDASLQKQLTSEATAWILYFENHFRNLIDFEVATSKYHNISKATAKGWEFQMQIDSHQFWSGRVGGTWMQTRDETTRLQLLRRAHQSLFLNFNFDFSPWTAAINYRWVGPRRDLDPQSLERIRLRSYDVMDFSGAFFLQPEMEIYGRIQNIFNCRHQELAGYQFAPLGAYVGIKGRF